MGTKNSKDKSPSLPPPQHNIKKKKSPRYVISHNPHNFKNIKKYDSEKHKCNLMDKLYTIHETQPFKYCENEDCKNPTVFHKKICEFDRFYENQGGIYRCAECDNIVDDNNSKYFKPYCNYCNDFVCKYCFIPIFIECKHIRIIPYNFLI